MEVARTTRRDTFIAGRSKGPYCSRAYTRTADVEESEAGGTRGRSRCSTSRFATISAMSSSALWTRLRLTASVSKA
jgi:hypothetical protein